jgi:hypothetical protein
MKHFLYIFKILLIIAIGIFSINTEVTENVSEGNPQVNLTSLSNSTKLTFHFNKRTAYYYINLI